VPGWKNSSRQAIMPVRTLKGKIMWLAARGAYTGFSVFR
jgi:hypothetical protein